MSAYHSQLPPQTPFAVRGQYKNALPSPAPALYADEPTLRARYGRLPALLSSDDELALCRRIQRGDSEARNELVVANIRLARRCACLFIASRQHVGALTLDDLIQEALIGVMRAAGRYDGRGKFSTYAVWWIKQAMSRALDEQAEIIGAPTYVHTAYKKVRSRAAQIENTGKPVTLKRLEQLGVSRHEVEVMRTRPQTALSYDRPNASIPDNHGEDWRNFIPNPADVIEPITEHIGARDTLAWIKAHLTTREWTIFTARAMPDAPTPYYTLGRGLGISHERCRQIMAHVQLKLIAQGLCPDGSIQPNGPRAHEARVEIKRLVAAQVERNRVLDARKAAKRQAVRQAKQARTLERREVSG